MKIKKIKLLLSDLYYGGVYDGIDIKRGTNDRFYGNATVRALWEKEQLHKAFEELKELIK